MCQSNESLTQVFVEIPEVVRKCLPQGILFAIDKFVVSPVVPDVLENNKAAVLVFPAHGEVRIAHRHTAFSKASINQVVLAVHLPDWGDSADAYPDKGESLALLIEVLVDIIRVG